MHSVAEQGGPFQDLPPRPPFPPGWKHSFVCVSNTIDREAPHPFQHEPSPQIEWLTSSLNSCPAQHAWKEYTSEPLFIVQPKEAHDVYNA